MSICSSTVYHIAAIWLLLCSYTMSAARNDELIPLKSTLGQKLLFQSSHKNDFWLLDTYFTTQMTSAWCSIASSTMVLNALPIPRPPQHEGHLESFPFFTQDNFATNKTEAIITLREATNRGLSLPEIGRVLNTFTGVAAHVVFTSSMTTTEFRQGLKSRMDDASDFTIVNYYRAAIGQIGGGHFSPVAAYNAEYDRFLILDVARYKYPPVWVPTELLYKATAKTVDSNTGLSRGYVTVTHKSFGNKTAEEPVILYPFCPNSTIRSMDINIEVLSMDRQELYSFTSNQRHHFILFFTFVGGMLLGLAIDRALQRRKAAKNMPPPAFI